MFVYVSQFILRPLHLQNCGVVYVAYFLDETHQFSHLIAVVQEHWILLNDERTNQKHQRKADHIDE
jgi:hypothetical protein